MGAMEGGGRLCGMVPAYVLSRAFGWLASKWQGKALGWLRIWTRAMRQYISPDDRLRTVSRITSAVCVCVRVRVSFPQYWDIESGEEGGGLDCKKKSRGNAAQTH